MSRQVWRFPLGMGGQTTLTVPLGSRLLDAGFQASRGRVSVWFLVNTDETLTEQRNFYVSGTGHPIPEHIRFNTFARTVILPNDLVAHVVEVMP